MGWDAGADPAACSATRSTRRCTACWHALGEDEHPRSASAETVWRRCGVVASSGPSGSDRPERPDDAAEPDTASTIRAHPDDRSEGGIAMAKVYNWQLGRDMAIPTRRSIPRGSSPSCSTPTAASAARPAPWPARAPGPSPRARNTCGGTTSRPSPTAAIRRTGTQAAGDARGRQPGRPVWNAAKADGRAKHPTAPSTGKTIFEAAEKHVGPRGRRSRSGLPAHRRRMAAPQHPRRHGHRRQVGTTASSAARRSCPSTASGSSTWPGSATTAPTPAAWPPARGRRSTSGPKTASC